MISEHCLRSPLRRGIEPGSHECTSKVASWESRPILSALGRLTSKLKVRQERAELGRGPECSYATLSLSGQRLLEDNFLNGLQNAG